MPQAAAFPMFVTAPFGLVLGAIVGSFLAVALIRWPKGEQAVAGRSRCDGCGADLRAVELVPLISFLTQRGRCRRCGHAIDRRHVGMEAGGALIGLVATLALPASDALVAALLGWWLLLVAALDADHHWLPDSLTLPLLPLGLFAGWCGFGPPLPDRLIGAAAGFAGLAALAGAYRLLRGRDGLGGGDPKLLAGLGAWLGWMQLPFILLGAGLLGLAAVLALRLRGERVAATTRLPLGTLMAIAAWPFWLVVAARSVSMHVDLL